MCINPEITRETGLVCYQRVLRAKAGNHFVSPHRIFLLWLWMGRKSRSTLPARPAYGSGPPSPQLGMRRGASRASQALALHLSQLSLRAHFQSSPVHRQTLSAHGKSSHNVLSPARCQCKPCASCQLVHLVTNLSRRLPPQKTSEGCSESLLALQKPMVVGCGAEGWPRDGGGGGSCMPVLPSGVVLGRKNRQKTVYFTADGNANVSTIFKITSSTTKPI